MTLQPNDRQLVARKACGQRKWWLCSQLQLACASVVLLALMAVPAPLLPPHRLAQLVQSTLGVGWMTGYLAAAVGLQGAFYVSLGVLASFVVNRAPTLQRRLLQLVTMPMIVVSLAVA